MMRPFFFDYIYYRVTKVYFRWDGRTSATAIATVTMIQSLLIIDITVFIKRLFFEHYKSTPSQILIILLALIIIGLMIFNYRKYLDTYNKFRTHWKNESPLKKRLKGFLVIFSILMPWLPLILLSVVNL